MALSENTYLGSSVALISACRLFVLHPFNRLSHLCLSLGLRPLRCLPSSFRYFTHHFFV